MTAWRYKISIKYLLTADEDDALVPALGAQVAEILKKAPDYKTDEMLQDIVVWFEESTTVDFFNSTLDELYDWADDVKVWIE